MTGTTQIADRDVSLVDALAVAADLGVDPARGLSAREAADRLASQGPNVLRVTAPIPWWRKLATQFRDPLVSLLLVAMAISIAAWVAEGAGGLPVDAIVIALIVVANATLGFVQERRAESAVAALSILTAASATVLRDGLLATVPAAELVRGDVLVLAEGDAVGADARLISATGLRVQEAALTGESVASEKQAGTLPEPVPLGDRRNVVFKGTAVVQGVGRAVVTGTGMATEVGAVADLLDRTEVADSPLQREIATVSRTLGGVVIGIALVVMASLALVNGVHDLRDALDVLLMGVSLAVAAVPEGLPAILSLVLALGVRALAKRNAVVKNLHSVETLGSASVICSDKTGTLTRNEMTLRLVVTASGEVRLTGSGYEPVGEAVATPAEQDPVLHEAQLVLVGGALANNAQLEQVQGEWQIQGDPTEAAFLVAQHKLPGTEALISEFIRGGEVPFTSERKLMSVVSRHPGQGISRLFTKGAPDVLLGRCDEVQVGDKVRPLDEAHRAATLATIDRLSQQGYRTLGVAFRHLEESGDESGDDAADESWEHGLVWLGVAGILDPPREEASHARSEAHRAGIRTIMITGDHPVTAHRIATDLGMVEAGARTLSGTDLDALSDEGLRRAVGEVSVFARVAPAHKLRIIDALQEGRHVVAMTGDGVNDAPALRAADIGVAMGITGTEVTKEAASMILADDNYATIVAAVHQGRVIFDNIQKFLRYLLSSNLGEVATVFFGVVLAGVLGLTAASESGLVVPLLATQILWINLVTDSGPALAMGVDPEIDDVMARKPRRPDDRIINAGMWGRIVATGLLMGAVTLVAIDVVLPGGLVPGGLVPGSGSLEAARTAGFSTLVLAQLFNALNARSARSSAFRGLFGNGWLWASLGLGAVLQVLVVHLPPLQVAFGTVPLTLEQWAMAVGLASIVLWVDEVTKLVLRRWFPRP